MNVAINGFGRIGRNFLRCAAGQDVFEVVAVNDLADAATMAHLFRYDSVHGPFAGEISVERNGLRLAGKLIRTFSEKSIENLPWRSLGIDVAVESTGRFTHPEQAFLHIKSGARQVILSAPPADRSVPTVVLGVNDHLVDLSSPVLSNASCTTNNVAPLVKILDENWGIKDGYITTVHSMTGDQNLHDAPHRDLRRARAAPASIIPTSTGAAKAITLIFPHLEGRLGGAGIRVPVLNGSLTDFTCILEKECSVEQINAVFKQAAATNLKHILQYTEDPIVSVDILNNPHSCIFDAQLTSVVGGLVKVVGWYDNETGYASRLADLLKKIAHGKH